MDTKKLKHFQILNQMNIGAGSITCASCKNWLTTQIYLHSDGITNTNYCKTCSLLLKSDSRRNEALEDVMKNLLFPCKYVDCESILKCHMYDDHVVNCIYPPNGCSLCDQNGMSLTEYEDHLETKHADKMIKLDKPVLNLTLNEPTKTDIIIATFHNNIFLCHISFKECMLSVNVANVTHLSDNVRNNITVHCSSDAARKTFEKRFIMHSKVSINSNYNADIIIDVDETLNLEIILCDYEKALQLAVCPICNHDVGLEVSQCVNGHNVCASCGKKMTKCAICRSSDMKPMKLQYLFPNALMLCPNFDEGCLVVSKGDDFVAHVDACVYSSMNCSFCDEPFLQCNIVSHMYEHGMCENIDTTSISITGYFLNVQYKNQVFIFTFRMKARDDKVKIVSFTVQLLYDDSIAAAQKYKYEIHIIADEDYKATHILKGVCQTAGDHSPSSSIYYNSCVELLHKVDGDEVAKDEDEDPDVDDQDDVKFLNVRCVILEVD